MENNKIDMFIATMSDKFDSKDMHYIKTSLEKVDDEKFTTFQSLNLKNPTTALILSLFLGSFGVDRFYIGNTLYGVLKLLTLGGVGIWTIIDWFLIMGATRKSNLKKFTDAL